MSGYLFRNELRSIMRQFKYFLKSKSIQINYEINLIFNAYKNYLKRKRNSYKAISNSSLRGTSTTTDQDVPPRQHLQRIQREIHPGQEITIIPPGRHIQTINMPLRTFSLLSTSRLVFTDSQGSWLSIDEKIGLLSNFLIFFTAYNTTTGLDLTQVQHESFTKTDGKTVMNTYSISSYSIS